MSSDLHPLISERSDFPTLEELVRNWLAANTDELRTQLLAREDEIVDRAAELVVELDLLTAELRQLKAGVIALHRARGFTGEPAALAETTLDVLVTSARKGTRMLQEPLTPQRVRKGELR